MTEREIDNEYFKWMCSIVCDDFEDMPSYTKLLKHLHNKEYTYVIDMDGNRAQDGLDLRRHFAFEDDYSPAIVTKALINRPCMVLEMMVALAARCEVTIGDDIRYGDRTHIWFWNMIKSLGLTSMNDARYTTSIYRTMPHELLTNRKYLNKYHPNSNIYYHALHFADIILLTNALDFLHDM